MSHEYRKLLQEKEDALSMLREQVFELQQQQHEHALQAGAPPAAGFFLSFVVVVSSPSHRLLQASTCMRTTCTWTSLATTSQQRFRACSFQFIKKVDSPACCMQNEITRLNAELSRVRTGQ
jgi:hypothetical protein